MVLLVLVAAVIWFLLHSSKGQTTAATGAQTSTNGLDNITQAIAQYEGFNKPGSVAQRTNNPGNVGTFGGNVASYSNVGDGWSALQNWVTNKAAANPSMTFNQMMGLYLTGSVNGTPGPNQNPAGYAQYIADYVGVDPNTPVSTVLGS